MLGGLWYFDRSGNAWFAYLGGAVEGVSAAFLWASAGFVAYSYAEEKDKALYITIQWCLTEGGSTIAALVALGININAADSSVGAPTPVYIVFIVIQVFAMIIALTCLIHPSKVTRSDGTSRHLQATKFQRRNAWSSGSLHRLETYDAPPRDFCC